MSRRQAQGAAVDPVHFQAGKRPLRLNYSKMQLRPGIHVWLDRFAEAVRRRDYEAGARMFCPEMVSFGTVSERAIGLGELRRRQWEKVWPHTADFGFDLTTVMEASAADQDVCVLTALWGSHGLSQAGGSYSRRGRATIVLRRAAGSETGWLAMHTHFSISPTGRTPAEEGPAVR
jgi:ketosteroid isomerase-like protein